MVPLQDGRQRRWDAVQVSFKASQQQHAVLFAYDVISNAKNLQWLFAAWCSSNNDACACSHTAQSARWYTTKSMTL